MPCANLSLISEIIKFLQVVNFEGILGNSGYEDGVGKKIGVEGSKLPNLPSLSRPRLAQWWRSLSVKPYICDVTVILLYNLRKTNIII